MAVVPLTSTVVDYHRTMSENAVAKRFNERWVADPGFRKALFEDTTGTLARYGFDLGPEDISSLLSGNLANHSAVSRAMWRIVYEKHRWVDWFYKVEAVPDDPRIKAWRERQIARQVLDLGPWPANSNLHASLCVELTKGCSVGCWFCGVSADRFGGAFRRDEANAALWRETLRVFQDRLGRGAKSGFLYWATDPLDNPDYEQLCVDFHEVLGIFPPTTTALALKDPARTRAFLALAEAHDCWLNRFSILSIKMLDRVHGEFSAEELAVVECLPLNRETAFAFGNAGRFREKTLKDPSLLERQRDNLRFAPWFTGNPDYADSGDDYPIASIGCVTGFLVNMVERSVQLISPCTADDRWPLGYYVYAEDHFDDAGELAELLDRMIERQMSPTVCPSDRPRFLDFLRYEELPDGFRLQGRFHQIAVFEDPARSEALRATGRMVRDGGETAGKIVTTVASQHGVAPDAVQTQLNRLLGAGVLDEVRG
jgi:radical SAM family RiPP maturation amino acid epimerase